MEIARPESKQPIPPHATKVFEGKLFDVYQWEQSLFDGSTATFEKLKRDDTVAIIPTLPGKKLIIIEDEQPGRAPVLTFPGGRIDPGEDPLTAVHREFLEETGYKAGEIEYWKGTQPTSKMEWAMYFFIGRNCTLVTEPNPGPGERITVREVTLDEVIELIESGTFQGDLLRNDFLRCKFDAEYRTAFEHRLFGE